MHGCSGGCGPRFVSVRVRILGGFKEMQVKLLERKPCIYGLASLRSFWKGVLLLPGLARSSSELDVASAAAAAAALLSGAASFISACPPAPTTLMLVFPLIPDSSSSASVTALSSSSLLR